MAKYMKHLRKKCEPVHLFPSIRHTLLPKHVFLPFDLRSEFFLGRQVGEVLTGKQVFAFV